MAFVPASSFVPAAASRARVCSARTARVAAPRMALAPPPLPSHALEALTVASKESDFGGYILPIIGLTAIGIIIALLTPPVKE